MTHLNLHTSASKEDRVVLPCFLIVWEGKKVQVYREASRVSLGWRFSEAKRYSCDQQVLLEDQHLHGSMDCLDFWWGWPLHEHFVWKHWGLWKQSQGSGSDSFYYHFKTHSYSSSILWVWGYYNQLLSAIPDGLGILINSWHCRPSSLYMRPGSLNTKCKSSGS